MSPTNAAWCITSITLLRLIYCFEQHSTWGMPSHWIQIWYEGRKSLVSHVCGGVGSKMPKQQTACLLWNTEAACRSFHGSLPCCQGAIAGNVLKFRTARVRVTVNLWVLELLNHVSLLDARTPPLGVQTESQREHPGVSDSSLCTRSELSISAVK